MTDLTPFIRDVPDFPKPGILFKDISPLLADAKAFGACIDALAEHARELNAEVIVGMESRGFIFGTPLALKLGLPFVPARKPGKLPAKCVKVEYELEYGTDSLEMHEDAFSKGARVLVVDDLIATGGTAAATAGLVEKVGGVLAGYLFVIELGFLDGRKKLGDSPVRSLIKY